MTKNTHDETTTQTKGMTQHKLAHFFTPIPKKPRIEAQTPHIALTGVKNVEEKQERKTQLDQFKHRDHNENEDVQMTAQTNTIHGKTHEKRDLKRKTFAIKSKHVRNTESKNETYTPLEKQVMELKRANPDMMLMVQVGYKMKFFGEDAVVL